MSNLDQFRIGLQALGLDPNDRPFLCSGSPLACSVFIVGFNPATTVPGGFWQFWSDETGYDREAFMRAYLATRGLKGARPRIEAISRALPNGRSLETNIHSLPTAKAAELGAERKTTSVFEFLFDRIAPKAVFAHSKGPIDYFHRETGVVAGSEPQPARWRGRDFVLMGRSGPLWRAKIDDARLIGKQLGGILESLSERL